MSALFPGFERKQNEAGGARINAVCGHYPPEERPGELARRLERFLR